MTLTETDIQNNLAIVHERIEKAAAVAHRSSGDVKLVVVSKRQPVEIMASAARAGVTIFGENYAEEMQPKQSALADFPELQWHMIGHIQSRKAKLVAESVDFVHSVDSLDLALRLDRELATRNRRIPILLEMNVSSEESKGGWPAWDETRWDEIIPPMETIMDCQQLAVAGLMVMPPIFADSNAVRPYFRRLVRLRDYLAARFPTGTWTELSMGTSADFEVAIQEGATFIRVGQAILGPRPAR